MSEFSLEVNQSLVDKSLSAIDRWPYTVVEHPSTAGLNAPPEFDLEEILPDGNTEFDRFGHRCLEILEEESDSKGFSRTSNVGIHGAVIEKYQPTRHEELLNKAANGLNEDEVNELNDLNETETLKEALQMGGQIAALYVTEHANRFDQEIRDQAELILNSESFEMEQILGLGDFFRGVVRTVRRAVSAIARWFGRQIKKIIEFGKVRIDRLVIQIMERPHIDVGNPFKVNNIKVKVATIRVAIPYRLFRGKWRTVYFTLNDRIKASSSGTYDLSVDNFKIYVNPRFSDLTISVKILGIWFNFRLAAIANFILKHVGKFEVYDASTFVTPMQVADLTYELKDVKLVNLRNALRIDVFVDVS